MGLAGFTALTGCENIENEPYQPEQTLSFDGPDGFTEAINPMFNALIEGKTCSSSSCHDINSGNGGRFKIHPNIDNPEDVKMTQNYLTTLSFINIEQPQASTLLLEPLSGSFASVGFHGGGDIFIDVDDDNYLRIYRWIANPVSSEE